MESSTPKSSVFYFIYAIAYLCPVPIYPATLMGTPLCIFSLHKYKSRRTTHMHKILISYGDKVKTHCFFTNFFTYWQGQAKEKWGGSGYVIKSPFIILKNIFCEAILLRTIFFTPKWSFQSNYKIQTSFFKKLKVSLLKRDWIN